MPAHMPTVGSRRLVIELRQFREAAGLTGEQVAEQMGWSVAKVYRIEGDKVRVLPRDAQRLLTLYGIGGEQAEAVMELARLARAKDWWHQYSGAIPEWFQFYVGLEAATSAMQEYCAELVTGLLQTEAYARAVMAAAARSDTEEMDRQVTVRLERQRRLTAPDAPSLWVVLDEAVLHRQVGGPAVMAAQLTHIDQMAGQPNVTVQVLPFTAGAHPAMLGSFTLMQFPDPADKDVVYLEAETGALYLEKPEDVRRYSLMIDYLRAQALGPAESRALIAQMAERSPD
jgi:transcriptional regulator with XRE-family HTH domain